MSGSDDGLPPVDDELKLLASSRTGEMRSAVPAQPAIPASRPPLTEMQAPSPAYPPAPVPMGAPAVEGTQGRRGPLWIVIAVAAVVLCLAVAVVVVAVALLLYFQAP
jgi:hypothetical protein